jgi:hypothetical protein
MANQTEFLPSIDEKFQIKIFGKKVSDLEINSKKGSILSKNATGKLILVKVYGTKLLGDCIKLPVPFFTLLPDNGMPSDACGELGNPDEYLMWILGKSQEFVALSVNAGNVEEIIRKQIHILVDVSADFHFHDVTITGSSISGRLRAYLHLHQKLPWPLPAIDVTIVDGDYPFSVSIDTCITVATVAVVSAQVCFHTSPNRVCGEVSVGIDLPVIGHWGQNFPIACVQV